MTLSESATTGHPGKAREVLLAFLRLGLTSFGGPAAHLGYFRTEFVERRRWLSEQEYAELVGLCQFLPGPASSQVGFALGLLRAGPLGALAAWAGFTLPSALLLVAFAAWATPLTSSPLGLGLLHGLKIVAVAIVAHAVWGMARSLCPDRTRTGIALVAMAAVTLLPISLGQIGAILLGAVAGVLLCREDAAAQSPRGLKVGLSPVAGVVCLALFAALLLLPPLFAGATQSIAVFDAFYRAGALVFGGGHVVLPLLREGVVGPGWMSDDMFLAGYGAAQAVPGPLFTFAAFLGAALQPGPGGLAGAAMPLVAVFLPGLLLLVGVLPFWASLRARPVSQAAIRGVNAAVVGLLGAALYSPVWTSAVLRPLDFLLALSGFLLLTVWRTSPLVVVALGAAAGLCMAWAG